MKARYGLLIDYEFCTGCYTCQVACQQEHRWPEGMSGIRVMEVVQELPKGRHWLAYIPFPTELCILCPDRVKEGLEPACVAHCMAGCMKFGQVEDLAKELARKPRQVLWVPR